MTQHVIDYSGNPSGANLLDVLLTNDRSNELTSNSGSSRPSYAVVNTVWVDTTSSPWIWKMFNGTADIVIGSLNPTSLVFTPSNLPTITAAGTTYSPASPLTATNVQDGINQVVAIINALNTVFLPLAGGTLTGKLITIAGATSAASANLPHGVAPTTPVNGDIWTTTAGIFARINGVTKRLNDQAPASFTSTDQTITAGGSLTIAHGLSFTPYDIIPVLVCYTAEAGYSVNDPVPSFLGPIDYNSVQYQGGVQVVPNATNLNVQFGAQPTTTFAVLHKTTGLPTLLTNNNWRIRFIAK
jgi:hypothetical protein